MPGSDDFWNCRMVGGFRRKILRSNSKRMSVTDSANITRRKFTATLIRRKIRKKKSLIYLVKSLSFHQEASADRVPVLPVHSWFPMAVSNNTRICTYNCRGWNSSKQYVSKLLELHDLCLIQEHWLLHDHLNSLNFLYDVLSVAVSGMDDIASKSWSSSIHLLVPLYKYPHSRSDNWGSLSSKSTIICFFIRCTCWNCWWTLCQIFVMCLLFCPGLIIFTKYL